MKKIVSFFLVLLIAIATCACGNENESTVMPDIVLPTTSSETQTTTEKDDLHQHEYSKATCTQAAKCECGHRNGSALGHKVQNGVCMVCGEKVTETSTQVSTPGNTNTHTHSFSKATCTAAAKCSCGQTQGGPLGHTLVNGVCSVCGVKPAYNVGNVLILGDSISTFEGYIPQGNATY